MMKLRVPSRIAAAAVLVVAEEVDVVALAADVAVVMDSVAIVEVIVVDVAVATSGVASVAIVVTVRVGIGGAMLATEKKAVHQVISRQTSGAALVAVVEALPLPRHSFVP